MKSQLRPTKQNKSLHKLTMGRVLDEEHTDDDEEIKLDEFDEDIEFEEEHKKYIPLPTYVPRCDLNHDHHDYMMYYNHQCHLCVQSWILFLRDLKIDHHFIITNSCSYSFQSSSIVNDLPLAQVVICDGSRYWREYIQWEWLWYSNKIKLHKWYYIKLFK